MLVCWSIGSLVNKSISHYRGWFFTPKDLKSLVRMVLIGPNSVPKVPSKTQEKKLISMWNQRVKWSSFIQKRSFWCHYQVGFTTKDPQNLVGMIPVGAKFAQKSSLWHRKKIELFVKSKSHTVRFQPKNGHFGVITRSGFAPPRTQNIWWGWFLWVPNFANKSPLKQMKKIWPVCEI